MPTAERMSLEEIALRQSLEIINNTIQDLCLRRDMLAGLLQKAPKQVMSTHFRGRLIKASTRRNKKKTEVEK